MRISSCGLLSTSQTRVAAPQGRQIFDKPLTRRPLRLSESSLGPARPRCAVKKDESSFPQRGSLAGLAAGRLKPWRGHGTRRAVHSGHETLRDTEHIPSATHEPSPGGTFAIRHVLGHNSTRRYQPTGLGEYFYGPGQGGGKSPSCPMSPSFMFVI